MWASEGDVHRREVARPDAAGVLRVWTVAASGGAAVVVGEWALELMVVGMRVASSTAEPEVFRGLALAAGPSAPRAPVLIAGLDVPRVEGVGLVR